MEGRMVRTDQFKYCVYEHGTRRESLVDMKNDSGEMNDLAADPGFREVILKHRGLLTEFARKNNDPGGFASIR